VILVVGLGNPGREHENRRHNAGFMVADALRSASGWPEYRSRFDGWWTRGELLGQPVVLLKPQTFMNLSGDSVQPAAAFLKVAPADIVVVHDELDLSWPEIRIKVGGGHAGHNGVRSIQQRLGTAEFARLRLGVGRPPASYLGTVADWVLSGWGPEEHAGLPDLTLRAVAAVRSIAGDGLAPAMKLVNTKK
jgi:PTH1 family peptidyl-tRNA hydrolase